MTARAGWAALGALLGAALLAACGSAAATPTAPPPPTESLATAYPMMVSTIIWNTPSPFPYPPAETATAPAPAAVTAGAEPPPPVVELARKDLAQRLAVPVDQITVEAFVYQDWPDGSLGCPKLGVAYTQAIVPGYRITLKQAQTSYDYHTDLTDRLVLCER